MSEHTKGPWKAIEKSYYTPTFAFDLVAKEHFANLYFIDSKGSRQEPENKAKARMIEAAPQLYEELKELVAAMHQYGMDVDEDPPYKHREMMQRAEETLALVEADSDDSDS